MKVRLIAVGQRPPAWVVDGFTDYARRLPRDMPLTLLEVQAVTRGHLPPDRIRRQEAERLLGHLGPRDHVVALDVEGAAWSTETLAKKLDNWRMDGQDLAFLVGGADGLDQLCLQRADDVLSLSALTFPHALVRVMVAEQIYRAWTILTGHPYHRA